MQNGPRGGATNSNSPGSSAQFSFLFARRACDRSEAERRGKALLKAAVITLLLVRPAIAATDPGQAGPHLTARETVSLPATAGATLSVDVFYPRDANGSVAPGAVPCPVIVLGHGFSQSKSQHTNQGFHLASRGFLVLIPNFAGGSDHSRNADDLSKCLDWMVARNAGPASRFFKTVRVQRMGATGHSAGGLSALVAASRDSRVRAVAPMDPVDNNSLGVNALASVSIPVAITYSEPSSCNASGSAAVLYAAAPAAKRGIKIVGANHTDPQDPAGFLSVLTCGMANSARQTLYRRYVTGWFEYYLKADQSYAPFVFALAGGQAASDVAAGLITYDRIAPQSALGEWRATNFGEDASNDEIAGALADPDRDGLPNLAEYALAFDPLAPSAQLAPVASLISIGGDRFGAIGFTRATMATDLSIAVEVSSNQNEWATGSSYSASGSMPNTALTSEVSRSGSGVEAITVRENEPAPGRQSFFRLRMSLLPPEAGRATAKELLSARAPE